MAINLSRNTKVYFTTFVNATTGVITDSASGFTSANTFEIQVLDGYSFGQTTNQTTIQVSEAGSTPSRGQRAFNTSLAPVDFSFSTYIRPNLVGANVSPAERVLWNALLGPAALDATGAQTITGLTRSATTGAGASTATCTTSAALAQGTYILLNGATGATTANGDWNQAAYVAVGNTAAGVATLALARAPVPAAGATATGTIKGYTGQWASGGATAIGSYTSSLASNVNQLQKFGMIFCVDQVVYLVDNCALDQASVDFGLDAISMVAWTGKGTVLKQAANITQAILGNSSTPVVTGASYITNKLSTMTLQSNIGGTQNTTVESVSYVIPITGGNITIANNLNYLTPTNLGVVNSSIGYYTGQRSISGNVTAYLRTGGSTDSGMLLQNLLTGAASTSEPKYAIQLEMGGATGTNRVEFEMGGVVLQIPAVNVADIVATTINFNAQGYTADINGATTPSYDITNSNELAITYYAAAAG